MIPGAGNLPHARGGINHAATPDNILVYGGSLAGLLLLCLTPLLTHGWPGALAVTFLQLPVYMIHQYEEHDSDRFRLFINRMLGKGREVLTPAAVFVINVPGVWGVIAVALYLTSAINPGFGLIAVYLLLVNAIAHMAAAVVLRMYNPGLITAVLLFLPLSAYSFTQFHDAGLAFQAIGLGSAVAIHAAIVGYARSRI
jgi:hypothetical protein